MWHDSRRMAIVACWSAHWMSMLRVQVPTFHFVAPACAKAWRFLRMSIQMWCSCAHRWIHTYMNAPAHARVVCGCIHRRAHARICMYIRARILTFLNIGRRFARLSWRSVDLLRFSIGFFIFSINYHGFCWLRGARDLQRCSTGRARTVYEHF